MAISTMHTYLCTVSSSTYTKLVDIKEFGDLGGSPEPIDVTTLSDTSYCYIPGIQTNEAISCTANYDKTNYATLTALHGTEQSLAIVFNGTESSGTVTKSTADGTAEFGGYVDVFVNGGGVNDPVEMTITITPTTGITIS